VIIPWQLRRDDLLFVLVPAGEKGPKYSGLLEHLESGGNIGCYPAPGSDLILLDIDDADEVNHGTR